MSPKIVSSNCTHRDCHPSIYEGDHRDYYLTLLPFLKPLSFLTVPNVYVWWDPVLSPKGCYSPLRVYQAFESTHVFKKGWKRIEERVMPRRKETQRKGKYTEK